MKFFWDTSAAINAALSPSVRARLERDEHFARLHLFHEFFSTMTGRGVVAKDADGQPLRIVFGANDAAKWLRQFCSRVSLVETDVAETLDGLDKAEERSVQGARVYDYAHALAAIKAGVDVILTRNENHFAGLTGRVRIERP